MKKFLVTIALVVALVFPMYAFADSNASANANANSQTSQGQTQGTTVNDVGNIKDSFNSQNHRGFAIPGEVNYGPVLNYFGKGNPSAAMQDVRSFLIYSQTFSEGALEEILYSVRTPRSEFKVVNRDIELAPADQDGVRWIKIVVLTDDQGRMKRYDGAQMVGYSVSEARNHKMTMLEVLAQAALDALQNGCNVLQITAQGSVNDVFSSGWGIGLHSTQAQVYSSGQDKSNVSSAGLGYSTARAGMRDLPWLQAVGLIDYELEFNRARIHREK